MTPEIKINSSNTIFNHTKNEKITESVYLSRVFKTTVNKTKETNEKILAMLNQCDSSLTFEVKNWLSEKGVGLNNFIEKQLTKNIDDNVSIDSSANNISKTFSKINYTKIIDKIANNTCDNKILMKLRDKIFQLGTELSKTPDNLRSVEFLEKMEDLRQGINILNTLHSNNWLSEKSIDLNDFIKTKFNENIDKNIIVDTLKNNISEIADKIIYMQHVYTIVNKDFDNQIFKKLQRKLIRLENQLSKTSDHLNTFSALKNMDDMQKCLDMLKTMDTAFSALTKMLKAFGQPMPKDHETIQRNIKVCQDIQSSYDQMKQKFIDFHCNLTPSSSKDTDVQKLIEELKIEVVTLCRENIEKLQSMFKDLKSLEDIKSPQELLN